MMETAHKSVLNEIEKSRVNSLYGFSSSSTEQSRAKGIRDVGHKTRNHEHAQSSKKPSKKQPSDVSEDELDTAVRGDTVFNSRSRSMRSSVNKDEQPEAVGNFLKQGWLYKTTRGKITSGLTRGQHEHRQHRKFQLTECSLEYSQLLQRVKVQKQIPLASIVDMVYNERENPKAFKLQFQTSEILLEAHDKRDCELWVKTIAKEWKKWPKPVRKASILNQPSGHITESSTEDQGFFRTGEEVKRFSDTGKDTPQTEFPSLLPSEPHPSKYLRRESDVFERSLRPRASHAQIAIQEKLGLIPRIHSFQSDKLQQKLDEKDDLGALRDIDFVMIKYPRKRNSNSLPHERVFTMDYENLLIMWRQTEYSKFNQLNTLLTEQIVDVREGQNSDGFDRYPYEEVEDQSLSILIEGEIQVLAGPASNTYAVLKSLDLVCNDHKEQQLWCRALKSIMSPKRHLSMFSSRFEFTDPTILWLKSHWILLSEGESEIKEYAALSFGRSVASQMPASVLKGYVDLAYQYKLKISFHHGNSLHWDNFILFYNLLCKIDDSNCLLLKLYQDYAKDCPTLGMTVEEFKKFLIEQQHWSPDDATDERCDQLMHRYDYYHRAFKMFLAKGNPRNYQVTLRLFSFAGFLSFLRSVDNCVIDREHEVVYQDMAQPLSHYFINSSHNTYLEGHQLTGRSTTDAYVRALLQGCRCLELDCWDGPKGEPKITHGNTLVSELSLQEVTETINEYAFCVSDYPIILSLENHCNETQQTKMAEIFQKVFGNKLVTKNLVEENNLNRLPSPEELKGKIILKGRNSQDERRTSDERTSDGRRASDERRRIVPWKRILGRIYSRSSDSDNESSELQAPQDHDMTNRGNSLESILSDDEDNLFTMCDKPEKTECKEEYKPEEQMKLHEDLSKLVVYCQAKRINPWSWKKQQQTSVCNMFSFVESAAANESKKHPIKMLACTERQFVRTYPSGVRIDSSNYDPHPMWNHGIQMVALNVQTPGLPMFLNQGKFRQNGGCGYILKPKIMRDPHETVYTPDMTGPHPAVPPVDLEITLLSGQNFIIPNKKTSDMMILYQTYGIPHDCESLRHMISSDNTNPIWPQCSGALKLTKTILMPELCLVLFAVYINVHRKLKAGTKQVLLGQNVFPLASLKSGIHYIPLRKPGGDPVSHIGIFVKIKLSQEQASDELEFSLDSDTQQTNELFENTIAVKNSDSQTTDVTNSESTHIGDGVHCKSQVNVTADVHCDNINNISSDC